MFVIQCVHMLKNQAFTKPWPEGVERENRIIFIGRDMQKRREELTEGFKSCIVGPLRFSVGTDICAKTSEDGYENGEIIMQWAKGTAYRIRLDTGMEVHAPFDEDAFVMSRPLVVD